MNLSLLAWSAAAMLAAEPLGMSPAPMQSDGNTLIMQLCDGGEITISLGKDGERQQAPHCPASKACHAGNCRSRFDLGQ